VPQSRFAGFRPLTTILIGLALTSLFLTGCIPAVDPAPTPTTYSLTYIGNGHSAGTVPVDTTAYESEDRATLAAPGSLTKSGYDFIGWNTSATGGASTRLLAGSSVRITFRDLTFYAEWQADDPVDPVDPVDPPVDGTFTEDTSNRLSMAIRDYYRAAYGLSGAVLKAKLQQIITTGHTPGTYTGLWTMFQTTDAIPSGAHAGQVWDMYSSTSADGSTAAYWFTFGTNQDSGSGTTEGQYYNREHTWPNSTFGGASNTTPYADGHSLTPTDKIVNNLRSNYSYGEVVDGAAENTYTQNLSCLGTARPGLGYGGTVFEPIDIYKGDHARMHFYQSLRYYGNSTFLTCAWAAPGAKLLPWYDTMLRTWAANDPVSAKEIARNNAVQAYQHNRNPFIDYPILIELLDLTE